MASVLLAWQLGADAVEIDVYLSKDKRIVVIHDSNTKWASGVEYAVKQTSAAQLRTLDVGRFKDNKYAGEKIPFLEEVIDSVPEDKKLYVEIKCGKEILPYFQQIIDGSGKRDQIVLISFSLDVVKSSKHLMPDIPAYWILGTRRDEYTKECIYHDLGWITTAQKYSLDGLDVHSEGLTKDFADAVRATGLGLYVWTVNDPVEAERLMKLRVQGITTDRPAWLKLQMNDSEKE